MTTKELISNLLQNTKLAVISTIGDPAPQSAVIEFGSTEELEIIFDTYTTSRKYQNLQKNPNVTFVIGWDENITVQYEGVAKELTGEEKKTYQKIYWQKNPEAQRWESREGITYFKATPRWIRYSDLNQDPWDVQEITIQK